MNTGRSRALPIAAVLAALVIVGTCLASAWQAGAFLPEWVRWAHVEETADLDGDGQPENIVATARRLSIVDGAGRRCQAPVDWLVAGLHVGDVTRDGTPDLVAITWKRGSFGTSKPFWVTRDETTFSQHVYILDYADGQLEQVWMSSALGFEVRSSSLDGAGRLHLTDGQGAETIWEWQSWGLALANENGSEEPQAEERGTAAADDTEARSLSLLAIGDVIAHDSMIADARLDDGDDTPSYDFTPLFTHVTDEVKRHDVSVANLETPLVSDPARYAGYPRFGTPTALGDALADAGFNVVTAATNHAYDQGEEGVSDTIAFWKNEHPETTLLGLHEASADAERCDYIERNGVKLALMDATYGLNVGDPPDDRPFEVDMIGDGENLVSQVEAAERNADATICFLHVGDEYSPAPGIAQRSLCERLIDAGADAIICTHPHVVQPVELMRTQGGAEGVVFWSLGNFASNQLRPETVLGGAAELTIDKTPSGTRISSYALIPTACHFERGVTQVYWLYDYTDSMARRHYVNTLGDEHAVTLTGLCSQFEHCRLPSA